MRRPLRFRSPYVVCYLILMLIAQISDTHILAKSSDRPEAGPRAENLRRTINDIRQLDPAPDIIIHTGDTVQTGAMADYDHLAELLSPLEQPLFLTPGNRDDQANFRAVFGEATQDHRFLHYSVEDYPIRLLALDSTEPEQRKGYFCSERQEWLDQSLAAAPNRPTMLFMHHPPFDVGPRFIDGYTDPNDRAALEAIVRRHPQVQRLVCGHCHRSSQRHWAGTSASTMGSLACDVREGVDTDHLKETPMYQIHAVAEDGSITTQTRLVF